MIFLLSSYSIGIIFFSLVVLAIIVFIRNKYLDYRHQKFLEELEQNSAKRRNSRKQNINEIKAKKDIKEDGYCKTFHKNGEIESEGNIKYGKEDGLWKYYYENGKLKDEVKWKIGKRDGQQKGYFEDGKLSSEISWKDGKLDGLTKQYHLNGRLKGEMYQKNNKIVWLRRFAVVGDNVGEIIETFGNPYVEKTEHQKIKEKENIKEIKNNYSKQSLHENSKIKAEGNLVDYTLRTKEVNWVADLQEILDLDLSLNCEFYFEFKEYFEGGHYQYKVNKEKKSSEVVSTWNEKYNESGWGDLGNDNEKFFDPTLPVEENQDLQVVYVSKLTSKTFLELLKNKIQDSSGDEELFEFKDFIEFLGVEGSPDLAYDLAQQIECRDIISTKIVNELPVSGNFELLWYSHYELEYTEFSFGYKQIEKN